jgi:hypothetical protein
VCSFQGAHDAPTSAFTALTLRFSEEMVARYPAVLTQLIVVAPSAPIFEGASREPSTYAQRLLLALSGHDEGVRRCPLLGGKAEIGSSTSIYE